MNVANIPPAVPVYEVTGTILSTTIPGSISRSECSRTIYVKVLDRETRRQIQVAVRGRKTWLSLANDIAQHRTIRVIGVPSRNHAVLIATDLYLADKQIDMNEE